MRDAPPNDPLHGLSKKQIFQECVWISDETTTTKLFLLCIGRYFDADAQNSSMSYAQIASDCTFTTRTAKREAERVDIEQAAKDARERWLRIKVQGGYLTPKGRQNLYSGEPPAKWIDELRRRKLNGVTQDHSGVTYSHPGQLDGVTQGPWGDSVSTRGDIQSSRGDRMSPTSQPVVVVDDSDKHHWLAMSDEFLKIHKLATSKGALKRLTGREVLEQMVEFCSVRDFQLGAKFWDEQLRMFDNDVALGRKRRDASVSEVLGEREITDQEQLETTQRLIAKQYESLDEKLATLEWCGIISEGLDDDAAQRQIDEATAILCSHQSAQAKMAKLDQLARPS